jgi:hypothetical protein
MPYFHGRFTRPPRRDKNQTSIIRALQAAGAEVADLSGVGKGVPDLLCGVDGGRVLFLVEVKREAGPRGGMKGRGLTPDQTEWRQRWPKAPVYIVRDVAHAVAIVQAIRAHGPEAGARE